MNILSSFVSSVKLSTKNLIKKDILDTLTVLPDNVRYALKYKWGALWAKEIASLLHPSFWACGFYMMMKFYDIDPLTQCTILSLFISHYTDYALLYQKLSALHAKISSAHTVIGSKTAVLNKYNFNGLDSKFSEITEKINSHKQKPIVLLYAWLLSLPSLLQSYQWDTILLFNSKKKSPVFSLQREWEVRVVSQQVLKNIWEGYVFVDDIHLTGKTYRQALSLLSESWHVGGVDIYSAVTMTDRFAEVWTDSVI